MVGLTLQPFIKAIDKARDVRPLFGPALAELRRVFDERLLSIPFAHIDVLGNASGLTTSIVTLAVSKPKCFA